MDVETVCTHADLAAELGSAQELENLLAAEHAGSSATFRAAALRDVLTALARTDPPIREGDLARPTELLDAVAYGALERIYRHAMAMGTGVFEAKRKIYADKFSEEMKGLRPTLLDSLRGSAFSFRMERG